MVAWVPPSRPRALAGTLLGGLALTGIAVVLTDRVLPSTPKRRHDGKSERAPMDVHHVFPTRFNLPSEGAENLIKSATAG